MDSASRPLVSIVTPVYNEAGYLAECIESIRAQTYQNWDYTIIDNCSTDGSLEIARRYAANDRRIKIHQNQEFLGPIPNHNVALREISPESKYCKVVLGDDWIFPNCLEQMVDLAEAHPSVGIVGAYALEGQRVAWTGLPYTSSLVLGREICRRHLLEGLHVFGSANAVLYRADLVRNRDPFYNETNIHADTEVCFALLKMCDFGFVHQILTFTRVRPRSLSAISEARATYLPGMLQLLSKYAPHYLTSREREALFARFLMEYYRFLGKSLMLRRDKQFWDYHKGELIGAGVGFSRTRLAKATLEVLCNAVANPMDTMRRLLQSDHKIRFAGLMQNLKSKPGVLTAKESQEEEPAA
jgi:glycosyltransferase involved in cell wall biosynthesis